MTKNEFNIVIPSRFGSSRFPGKPLHLLNGKAMILHVIDRARESDATNIVVATDDQRIATVCADAAVDVEMTDESHLSGTDRIAEVATRRAWSNESIVVGLQGDEPVTPASLLNQLATNLHTFSDANMATFCKPVSNIEDYHNSHRVKVVRDHRDMALYFSRASIPARRDHSVNKSVDKDFPESYIHIGLYAYRCEYLRKFSRLPSALIEREEQLEQLRVLYNGGRIHVDLVDQVIAGVDHPDDVAGVEALLNQL